MIFFDLDGTLLDVACAERCGARRVFDEAGFDRIMDFDRYFQLWVDLRLRYYDGEYLGGRLSFAEQQERRMGELLRVLSKSRRSPSVAEALAAYSKSFRSAWRLFDEVRLTLNLLSRTWRLGIITNGDWQMQRDKLRTTGIARFFEIVLTPGKGLRPKPNPDLFLEGATRSGLALSELCYVGDSVKTDVVPAQELGLPVVLVVRDGRASRSSTYPQVSGLDGLSGLALLRR